MTPREVHRELLRGAPRAVRTSLGLAVGAGLAAAAALVALMWAVADVVDRAAFGERVAASSTLVAVVLGAVVARALLAGGLELCGRRAAATALADLRERVAERALAGRAPDVRGARRGEVVTAATQGVDALADYYARALPQAALAAAVPLGVVVVIALRDPLVGALLGVTIPVVVVFMVLVGKASAAHARERQGALAVLGAHFLEVVRGLPTLRAHGREDAQAQTLRAVAERYRDESLAALRVAFLSALVLELLAMLGTAIAAATVGVTLAEGSLSLEVGLFVLLLAPEVYAPLRAAGMRFHAAEDGAQAARRLLAFLDEPAPLDGPAAGAGVAAPDPGRSALVLDAVGVAGAEGRADPLRALTLAVEPGRSLALVGPSGAGKSTALALLARLRDPAAGRVACGGRDLREVAPEAWWSRVTLLGQRPGLPTGTLGEALRLHAPEATEEELAAALRDAAAEEVVAALPDGLATRVGAGGRPLSLGQQQRLALAAALAARTPLVLLDEPTAHLDAATADRVAAGIARACAGRTLVVATHDPAVAAACDALVELGGDGRVVRRTAAVEAVAA